jgi:hypothetical protein
VAALHDTSVEMIEKHYAAYIIDMTEDMARKTLMTFDKSKRLRRPNNRGVHDDGIVERFYYFSPRRVRDILPGDEL